jgi:hypothetical protein
MAASAEAIGMSVSGPRYMTAGLQYVRWLCPRNSRPARVLRAFPEQLRGPVRLRQPRVPARCRPGSTSCNSLMGCCDSCSGPPAVPAHPDCAKRL